MTILEEIQQQLSELPPEEQSEVLDFIAFLRQRLSRQPRRAVSAHRRQAIKGSLEELAALGVFADITDPVAWQRQIRQDRPLPGREA